MARKPASSFEIVPIDQAVPRLEPPSYLAEERKLFESIVQTSSPSHFVRSDAHLLGAYCQACCLTALAYESALASPSHLGNWEKAVKTMVTLGRQLRLAPLGRVDPKTLTRQLTGRSYNSYPDLERIAEARAGTGPSRDWKARG
jgi:hypothetical protein